MSQPGRSTARITRHVTIPHPEGESRDNPSEEEAPSTLRQREMGAAPWPGAATQRMGPAPSNGAILEVNPKSVKYWDPKEENGGP